MGKIIVKKKFIFSVTLVVLATFISAGVMLAVQAETIDTTSCNGNLLTYYRDADADGYGNPEEIVMACTLPVGYSEDSTDCDDTNINVNPGETEICDGFDINCDGNINEDIATSTYYLDEDGDGYGLASSTTVYCSVPENYATDFGDCDDNEANINPGQTEICDGIDNNCDGEIDESCIPITYVYYRDADEDGYGDPEILVEASSQPDGYVADNSDCDDSEANVNPGQAEICDGIDNNCDGEIDEGVKTTFYLDSDGDGYGDISSTTLVCSLPDGYSNTSDDCDDDNASINPGVQEVDDDGVDNDCDGIIDEDSTSTVHIYYYDADGDSYGDPDILIEASSQPDGYVTDNSDCDDSEANVNPGQAEICDGIDNNCDGEIDEGVKTTFYLDSDGDGYGDSSNTDLACSLPDGYVNINSDCNDNNVNINPGINEINNDGVDNNCDGNIDEGCGGCCNDCQCVCSCECSCNGGNYVSCMAQFTNCLKKNNEITGREKGQIMREAAKEMREMIRQKFNYSSKNKNK